MRADMKSKIRSENRTIYVVNEPAGRAAVTHGLLAGEPVMRASRAFARGAAVVLTAAMLALAGCASTPQATPERDAEAKRFTVEPKSASIYIYRPDFASAEQEDSVIYLGSRQIGSTLPRTFFRIDVEPGAHLLRGIGPDRGQLKIDARVGELHFVMLNVINGQSRFTLVSPESGQRAIRSCCALMETWTPAEHGTFRFIIR